MEKIYREDKPELLDLSNNEERNINTLQRVRTVENAVINSITGNLGVGYVTIQYGIMDRNRMIHMHVVTLIVGRDTRIIDQFGNRTNIRNLKVGMVINARFSSVMTRSNPPLARAYNITVVKENESSIIVTDRVLQVDRDNQFGYILTGNANNVNSQTRFVVSDDTKLRDRNGNRIRFRDIRPGQTVRIERASFQTMSIPPQTNALTVQIIR